MGILDLFRRKPAVETRSSSMGYTAMVMAARQAHIAGATDLAEMTSVVQSCVTLWEGALAGADVIGTDYLDRRTMALVARSLALRGEFVGLIRPDMVVPCTDWDVATSDGVPRAYRVSISEAGGARSETALAGEVLHFRIGSDAVAPWSGTPPLRRAAISANLLHQIETALRETWADAPVGSQTLPVPDSSPADMDAMRSAIRGRRGSTLIIEGASQAAAAGMNVQLGQRPADLTPDLGKAQSVQALGAAQAAIAMAFGVLPAMLNVSATGPVIREGQRHLCQWVLEPMAALIAQEATSKLGGTVQIDVTRPLQAHDAGGKARAFSAMVGAMVQAKEAGIDPGPLLHMLDQE